MEEITKESDNHWKIKSENNKNKCYDIVFNQAIGKFTCNCPRFVFRNKNYEPCKHVQKMLLNIKQNGE